MLNNVTIMGRLCFDPEMRKTKSGKSVTNLRVAVRRNYANSEGEYDTDFFNVSCFGQLADHICKWYHKGNLICIEGELQNSEYFDEEKDTTFVRLNIMAKAAHFCGGEYTEEKTTKKTAKKK